MPVSCKAEGSRLSAWWTNASRTHTKEIQAGGRTLPAAHSSGQIAGGRRGFSVHAESSRVENDIFPSIFRKSVFFFSRKQGVQNPCWHPEHRSNTELALLLLKSSMTHLLPKLGYSPPVPTSLICQSQQKHLLSSRAMVIVLFWDCSQLWPPPCCNFPRSFLSAVSTGPSPTGQSSHMNSLKPKRKKNNRQLHMKRECRKPDLCTPPAWIAWLVLLASWERNFKEIWGTVSFASSSLQMSRELQEEVRTHLKFSKQAIRRCVSQLEGEEGP